MTIEQSYYHEAVSKFLLSNESQILGEITSKFPYTLEPAQTRAWREQIANLKEQLSVLNSGYVFIEFVIPRMGKRVDVVLLIQDVICVIEYKIGAQAYEKYAIDQVVDYALDLKNFHAGSRDKFLIPILVATEAGSSDSKMDYFEDRVFTPILTNGSNLGVLIREAVQYVSPKSSLEPNQWASSGYSPTPTIVEAARSLYQNHTVDEISRSDSGVTNLTSTANCIFEIVEFSKLRKRKSICFVTGVPGAGKTLAGLNIATKGGLQHKEEHAVFLSGNGPLVAVLREALARDEVERGKINKEKLGRAYAKSKVSSFIQNIHHFRDEGLRSERPPIENVVVFDEAQRAWNKKRTQSFMRQKRNIGNFDKSEPDFLLEIMDRKPVWCTVICLVGGGQEINTGEAGIVEWFNALETKFSHWDIYCSSELSQKEYSWGQDLSLILSGPRTKSKKELHLSVSIRSFRTEKLSELVSAIIDGDSDRARLIHAQIGPVYPIAVTRNLAIARMWLRRRARGSERFGLVASSGAIRLKPEGINVKIDFDPAAWFLNPNTDVRSSCYLEEVATEFSIQGLELDWVGVCWDADFRRANNKWKLAEFKGTVWRDVKDRFKRAYLANAYRVLLTRARQGMIIFVPPGEVGDYTRPDTFYNETYEFLKSCGFETV